MIFYDNRVYFTMAANGRRTDSTQEMIALGAGTILGSFVGSMPITASFGRSAVQSASGVKTPFTNVYAGNYLHKLFHVHTVHLS